MQPHKYQKHSDSQRTAILNRSRALFIEKGVAAVTMAEVAARCGVTRATLYRYYDGKERLLWDIHNQCTALLFGQLAPRFNSFEGTAYERFAFLHKLLKESFLIGRDLFLFNDVFNSLYQQTTTDPSWEHYRQLHGPGLGAGDAVRFLTAGDFGDGSLRPGLAPLPTAVAFWYGCIALYTKFSKVYDALPQKYGLPAALPASLCVEALLAALRP